MLSWHYYSLYVVVSKMPGIPLVNLCIAWILTFVYSAILSLLWLLFAGYMDVPLNAEVMIVFLAVSFIYTCFLDMCYFEKNETKILKAKRKEPKRKRACNIVFWNLFTLFFIYMWFDCLALYVEY